MRWDHLARLPYRWGVRYDRAISLVAHFTSTPSCKVARSGGVFHLARRIRFQVKLAHLSCTPYHEVERSDGVFYLLRREGFASSRMMAIAEKLMNGVYNMENIMLVVSCEIE
ncbi:hypothetical protein GOBAR_AA38293 [Gossypium barbadense]|uniref:Uncharacterized protein n=1 Tax=Gossypium barbadense TaxID=3634 RepID=A0A2P5VUA7_GOSBA|nr:hypothetical protein GOBAR_AA38293 [Gossypium barbadense]